MNPSSESTHAKVEPELVVALESSRLRTGATWLWLAVMAILGVQLVLRLPAEFMLPALAIYGAVGAAMGGIGMMIRRGTRHEGEMLIRVYGTQLRLPIGLERSAQGRPPGSPRVMMTVPVRYRDITALFVNPGREGFLWLGTSSGTFVYPLRAFRDPDDPARLVAQVRAHIDEVFDGPSRLEQIDAVSLPAQAAHSHRTPVSTGLILALLGVFGLVVGLNGAESLFGVSRFGAVAPVFLKEGQWWRLLVAPFLSDTSSMGLLFTAGGLMYVGRRLEQLVGGARLFVIYVLAGWVGVAVSTYIGASPAVVGTSSAAVGLLGAFAFLSQRRGEGMPLGFRFPLMWWLTGILMLGFFPSSFLLGDVPAQIGGVLGGVIAVALLVPDEPPLPLSGPLSRLVAFVLACAMGLTGVGAVLAVHHARQPASADDDLRVQQVYLDRNLGNAEQLNLIAWTAAINPSATRARLTQAKIAAARAVERKENGPSNQRAAVEDTLATLDYRLGDLDAAVLLEADVLSRQSSLVHATQLARFLADDPILRFAPGAPPLGLQITLRHHDARGFGLNLRRRPPITQPTTRSGGLAAFPSLAGGRAAAAPSPAAPPPAGEAPAQGSRPTRVDTSTPAGTSTTPAGHLPAAAPTPPQGGAVVASAPAAGAAWRTTLPPPGVSRHGPLQPAVGTPGAAPATIYGLIYKGPQLEGLLRFCLRPGVDLRQTQWLAREGTRPMWPADSRIQPVLVTPGCQPWQGWGLDPEVLQLP